MENALDALKMAAAVLAFIVALSTSFSLFGTAKQTADSIISIGDKQSYLESAALDNIEYLSSDKISSSVSDTDTITSIISGLTTQGDRIVGVDDVISTISRYNKEKYGVTIVTNSGDVIVRFDSNTEKIMSLYNNVKEEKLEDYIELIERNTYNIYTGNAVKYKYISLASNTFKEIYGDSNAVWYTNNEQIQKRIDADISGNTYEFNGKTYEGKGLLNILKGKKIVEVINEIEQSKFVTYENDEKEEIETNLLQEYKMPTIEIIYIIYE